MTMHTQEGADQLRAGLADGLKASGQLTDPTWRKVFEAVPRHLFVPEFWTLAGKGPRRVTSADPDWLDLVYMDDALATQLIDGVATWSSTAPGLMLVMLQALDIADGHRVLEIATGTGYNAALLSERLGSHQVLTVEEGAAGRAAASVGRGGGRLRTVRRERPAGPGALRPDRQHRGPTRLAGRSQPSSPARRRNRSSATLTASAGASETGCPAR